MVLWLFGLAPLGPPLYYLAALACGRRAVVVALLVALPVLGAMTTTLALRIAGASIAGLAGIHRPFETPRVKQGAGGPTDDRTEGPRRASDGAPRRHRRYRSRLPYLEAALMVYAPGLQRAGGAAGVIWLAVYCGLRTASRSWS